MHERNALVIAPGVSLRACQPAGADQDRAQDTQQGGDSVCCSLL